MSLSLLSEDLAGLLTGVARKLAQPRSLIPVSPEKLYHMVWQEVSRRIVDPDWLPADWEQWLHKFDGRIRTTEQAVERANEMLRSVKDWYTYLSGPEQVRRELQGLAGIGMTCGYQLDHARNFVLHADGSPLLQPDEGGHPIVRVNPRGAGFSAGLRTGDTIIRVDGVSTAGCSGRWLWQHITGKKGSYVSLLLGKSGMGLTVPLFIQRQPLAQARSAEARVVATGIGYINLREFSPDSQGQMEEALWQLKDVSALILDLRENIGGVHSAAIAISSMFIEKGLLVATEERIAGDPASQQYVRKETLLFDDNLVVRSYVNGGAPTVSRSSRRPWLVRGKHVVVLINGDAISCAELFAGAVKDNGAATLIGTSTAGKGIGQLPLEMPNGACLEITVDRYFTPSGRWPGDGGNRVANGVTPNIEVEPDKAVFDIGSAEDNQLSAALAHLEAMLKAR
jgi:carboxyl-terminal processing protease